ncbi:MAG TPA: FHA domain-containing protein [Kofleriaceae bacterium]|nr:FHA domain-containing protein [Kofleriaceae bacterium]
MDVGLVCDACHTFNPMGAPTCERCAAPLVLEGPGSPPGDGGPPQNGVRNGENKKAAIKDRLCPQCGATLPQNHKFCGECGHRIAPAAVPGDPRRSNESTKVAPAGAAAQVSSKPMAKKTLFFGAMQQARAKLVLIKGDGLDGVSFTLAGEEHLAGRIDVPLLFEEDPFLSPVHANFFYRDTKLLVRDEASVNGVYIRIRGTRPIQRGDRVLVGEQVLEIQATDHEGQALLPTADGTYFYGSPHGAEATMRIVQILRGGDTGIAYRTDVDVVSIGREGNDINFPDDPFISGNHAQVSIAKDQLSLTDLGSKNGTFLRVNHETALEHGDYVFMGQQLLRVEIV